MVDVKHKPIPKNDREHWLLGGAYYLTRDPVDFIFDNMRKHDGIFEITALIVKVLAVYKPEYIKYVLQDNNRNYTKSIAYDVALSRLLGKGLLTSEGDFWRKQRRMAQPGFHRERLNKMLDIMVACTEETIADLKEIPIGETTNIAKHMMALTLTVVAKAMFGSDVPDHVVETVGREIDISNEYAIQNLRKPVRLPNWVPTPRNLDQTRSIHALYKIMDDIIEARRKSDGQFDDLLQMLMDAKDEETGEQMSNKQLRDECMTIFLAGHETTALALSWLWLLLDENPDKRAKLLAEVDEVLGDRNPTLEDLRKLTYTRMCIDEAMRLYPPAWAVGRKTIEADVIGGHFIPPNTNIIMPVYCIHRDPELWENPNDFIPERFDTEKSKGADKFAYFPFGGGPRLCIGNNFALMEMQIIVAMLVKRFRFILPADQEVKMDTFITLRPNGGNLPMLVEQTN